MADDLESAARGRIGTGVGGLGMGRTKGGPMLVIDEVLVCAEVGIAGSVGLSLAGGKFLIGAAFRRGMRTLAGSEDTGRGL